MMAPRAVLLGALLLGGLGVGCTEEPEVGTERPMVHSPEEIDARFEEFAASIAHAELLTLRTDLDREVGVGFHGYRVIERREVTA